MRPRLLLIVDSERYIRANCYQSQLAETLEKEYSVEIVSIFQIKAGIAFLKRPRHFDRILSVLRMRTLSENLGLISAYVRDAPIFIYDQDVWQAYMDGSPWKGAYARIQARLNVEAFLVTSGWWCSFIKERGIRSNFVRMGMLPRLCAPGPNWDDRPYQLAFQGTIHPHRKVLIDWLDSKGMAVSVLPSAPYDQFLRNLHQMQIYVHSEDDPWIIDGKSYPRNALWIKDTEAAARGTFALRNFDEDMISYGTSELPTIFSYDGQTDVAEVVELIRSLSAREKLERSRESADRMRSRNDWMTVVNAIEAQS